MQLHYMQFEGNIQVDTHVYARYGSPKIHSEQLPYPGRLPPGNGETLR